MESVRGREGGRGPGGGGGGGGGGERGEGNREGLACVAMGEWASSALSESRTLVTTRPYESDGLGP